MFGWATVGGDWEWKYGYADFQDRFSPDLTVAETIGRQVGSWPIILAGGHPDPKDPRARHVWRTRLGVCLVHEIQTFDYRPASDAELYATDFETGAPIAMPRPDTLRFHLDTHDVRLVRLAP